MIDTLNNLNSISVNSFVESLDSSSLPQAKLSSEQKTKDVRARFLNPNSSIFQMLKTLSNLELSTIKQTEILEKQTEVDFALIDVIEEEKSREILELSQTSEKLSFWKGVVEPLRLVGSTASLIYNIPKVQKGKNLTGPYLFIASAVGNLGHKILEKTKAYHKIASFFTSDEEKQEKLGNTIQSVAGALSFGLGMTSICFAYQNGSFDGLIQKTSNFTDKIIGFRNGVLTNRVGTATALISDKDSLTTQIYHRIHDTAKSAQKIGSSLSDLIEKIKSCVDSYFSRI